METQHRSFSEIERETHTHAHMQRPESDMKGQNERWTVREGKIDRRE